LNKVFDTFIYSGEKDVLIARISQLKNHVDHFVIIESKSTFSGRLRQVDKSTRNKILEEYGNRIRWLIANELQRENAWEREAWQRQLIVGELSDIALGDLILLSDVDEIPSKEFILRLRDLVPGEVLIAQMKLLRYCAHMESDEYWHGTIAVRFDGKFLDLQALRMQVVRYRLEDKSRIVLDGGVHLTAFLSPAQFRKKIKSFSHTELDSYPFNNLLFLYLIQKLGLSIDGREILKINRNHEPLYNVTKCSSKHRFNSLRLRIAKLLQPSILKQFEKRVIRLSSPK